MRMAINMRDNGRITNIMAMACLKWMNLHIEVSSKMGLSMEKGIKFLIIKMCMREYMNKIISMDMVDISGSMDLFIKASFNQDLLKVLELGIHRMEISM